MNHPVDGQAQNWSLSVRKVQDGPDSISDAGFRYTCGFDERLLHVWVTLRNQSTQKRSWNWPRCGLDQGDKEYLPTVIFYDMFLSATTGMEEKLDPGEEIERRVIFTYPDEGPLPTQLRCGDILIPLQLK